MNEIYDIALKEYNEELKKKFAEEAKFNLKKEKMKKKLFRPSIR